MEKTVYELFDEFVEAFVEDKPYIELAEKNEQRPEKYWESVLKEIDECFVNNPIGSVANVNKAIKKNQEPDSADAIALELAKKLGVNEIDFFQKIDKQFEKSSEFAKEAFSNLLWLRHLPISDMTPETKTKNSSRFFSGKDGAFKDKSPTGLANYSFLRQSIYSDLKYLSELFKDILNTCKPDDKTIDCYKKAIRAYCEEQHGKSASIRNLLLHFCDRERFESIAANSIKEKIARNLYPFFLKNYLNPKENDFDKALQEIVTTIIDPKNNEFQKYKIHFEENGKRFFAKEIEKLWKNDYVADTYEILTNYQKQVILYGAPGTGKTYNALKVISEFLQIKKYEENNPRILKADWEEDYENRYQLGKIKFSEFEKENVDNGEMKYGDFSLVNNKDFSDTPVIWEIVQFNQTYSYEDFIEGMIPKNGGIDFKDGIFKRFVMAAEKNLEKDFVMIIDEINRGKIDKIFGELLYLLEYRDSSVRLHYSGGDFKIPKNVYLIGTMNTADKSIAALDVALRRRFWFVKCNPEIDVLYEKFGVENDIVENAEDNSDNVKRMAIKLFNYLNGNQDTNSKSKKEGVLEKELKAEADELKVGHSYFLKLIKDANDKKIEDDEIDFQRLKNIWFYSIVPLLEEYVGFDKKRLKDMIGNFAEHKEFTPENIKGL